MTRILISAYVYQYPLALKHEDVTFSKSNKNST